MLILTRRIGESIIIDDRIAVTVLNFKNNQIRFGISAPKEVPVHREEVYKRIQREKTRKTREITPNDWVALKITLNLQLSEYKYHNYKIGFGNVAAGNPSLLWITARFAL